LNETFLKNYPQVGFKNFQFFDMDKNKYVVMIVKGAVAEGFENRRYRMKNIDLMYQNTLFLETLKGNYAVYENREIDVLGDVEYERSDNSSITTNKLIYKIEEKKFYIPEEFTFRRDKTYIQGKTLIIERDSGKISAFNIQAILNE
jgi:lipopolysaccharide assembly outer membrane protein LptD (OstA)